MMSGTTTDLLEFFARLAFKNRKTGLASMKIPVFRSSVALTLREDREYSTGFSWIIMSESNHGKALTNGHTNADIRRIVMTFGACIFCLAGMTGWHIYENRMSNRYSFGQILTSRYLLIFKVEKQFHW